MRFSLQVFFFCVLSASIFFDDPHLYYYKRVIYVIFMGISLWQLYLFNFGKSSVKTHIPMPGFYKTYINIFICFILYNLVVDCFNPAFSLITQLNHPLAALAVVPVFAFKIGYQTSDLSKFIRLLFVTCLLFGFLFLFPIAGKNVHAQALACYYAVIPLFLFSFEKKEYRLFCIFLLILGFGFSQVSESRTIILRILLFTGLLVSLSMVKKWSFLKGLVVLTTAFFIVQFLTNLETYLELFKNYTGTINFDDEDTRTFLYKEVFGDMKPHELILGRGFQGTYFSNYFLWLQTNNHDFSGDHYYRFSVEVGFLQFLVKGGFVYFGLYVTPLIVSCYRGLFTRHNSRIAFLISIYILTELFIIFIENIPAYHFQFFIIFFLAGFAYRKTQEPGKLVLKNKIGIHEDFDHNTLIQSGAVY